MDVESEPEDNILERAYYRFSGSTEPYIQGTFPSFTWKLDKNDNIIEQPAAAPAVVPTVPSIETIIIKEFNKRTAYKVHERLISTKTK